MSMDIPPDLKEALPGVGGSLTALLFFRKAWPMMIALFCCGALAAKFAGGDIAKIMGTSDELGGYVTGAFAMAIIEGIIRAIQKFDWAETMRSLVQAVIKKLGG